MYFGKWLNVILAECFDQNDTHFSINVKFIATMHPWFAAKALNIFTDRTKTDGVMGTAFYGAQLEIKIIFKLANSCIVFQSEIFLIKMATELLRGAGLHKIRIHIYIHSQTDIHTIRIWPWLRFVGHGQKTANFLLSALKV